MHPAEAEFNVDESRNNLPLASDPEYLTASPSTRVSTIDLNLVLKEKTPGKKKYVERLEHETDEDYRERRLQLSLEYIAVQKEEREHAKSFIPDGIETPEEFFFIADGTDGFPRPYTIQNKVEGLSIKRSDVDRTILEHKDELMLLLKANRKAYLRTGKCLDLVGRSVDTHEKNFKTGFRKFLQPIEESENIFVTNDNKLALIDMEFLPSDSKKYQLAKFISLELAYWKLLARKKIEWKAQL